MGGEEGRSKGVLPNERVTAGLWGVQRKSEVAWEQAD